MRSKNSIKKSIEKIFKVNVVKINTINLKGKTKIVRNKKTFKSGYKKAIITLKKRSKYWSFNRYLIYGT